MDNGDTAANGGVVGGVEAANHASPGPVPGATPGWRRGWKMRLQLVYLLMVLWSMVLAGQLLMTMVWQRGDDRRHGEIWHAGTLPALRGRLLDSSGVPLAWSTRQVILTYQVPPQGEILAKDMAALGQHLALDARLTQRLYDHAGTTIVLRGDLSPAELVSLEALVPGHQRFRVQSQFHRHAVSLNGRSLQDLGQTQLFGQRELGISGWEQEYDAKLRGEDGKYRVQVDRQGRWIAATWQEIRPPTAGHDVYLPVVFTAAPENTRPALASRR
jgi:cell division protein FtsI/penicillin-binding protein 2